MKHIARFCFVPGCTTGYSKTLRRNKELGIRNNSLFKARNEAQLQKWRRIIPRKDREFRETDAVCDLHFNQEDIVWYYETKLPNGVVDKIRRDKPTLKSGAFPTIFSNFPGYLTKVRTKGKPPKERNPVLPLKRKRKMCPSSVDESTEVFDGDGKVAMLAEVVGGIRPCEVTEGSDEAEVFDEIFGGITPSEVTEGIDEAEVFDEVDGGITSCVYTEERYGSGVFDLTTLAESVKSIKLPSQNWTTAVVGRNVIFLCVGSTFLTEKTLVVSEDLSIKVILKRKEVSIDGIKAIKNMDDLIKVIGFLDVLQVCDGASDDESSLAEVL